jgi:hypothetical protein
MERAVGVVDVETAGVGRQLHGQSALVDRVMMPTTQRNHIAEVGAAAVIPFVNVMGLTPRQRTITPCPGAATVQDSQTLPLGIGSRAMPTTHINGDVMLVDHDPLQHGVAGQTGDRFWWQRCPAGGFPQRILVHTTSEGVGVDHHTDMRHP